MNRSLVLLIFITTFGCNRTEPNDQFIEIEIQEREFDFGTVHLNDTIYKDFSINNISKKNLYIKNIRTSCNCSKVGILDSIALPGETIDIKIQFIARTSLVGDISNTIVVETNTNPPFNIFKLNGFIVN